MLADVGLRLLLELFFSQRRPCNGPVPVLDRGKLTGNRSLKGGSAEFVGHILGHLMSKRSSTRGGSAEYVGHLLGHLICEGSSPRQQSVWVGSSPKQQQHTAESCAKNRVQRSAGAFARKLEQYFAEAASGDHQQHAAGGEIAYLWGRRQATGDPRCNRTSDSTSVCQANCFTATLRQTSLGVLSSKS